MQYAECVTPPPSGAASPSILGKERRAATESPSKRLHHQQTEQTKCPWLHCQDVGPLQQLEGPHSHDKCHSSECKLSKTNPQPDSNAPRTLPQLCQSTTPGRNAQQNETYSLNKHLHVTSSVCELFSVLECHICMLSNMISEPCSDPSAISSFCCLGLHTKRLWPSEFVHKLNLCLLLWFLLEPWVAVVVPMRWHRHSWRWLKGGVVQSSDVIACLWGCGGVIGCGSNHHSNTNIVTPQCHVSKIVVTQRLGWIW